jgi:hypothetical protein
MGESETFTTYVLRVQHAPAGEPPAPATLLLILEDVRTGERRAFGGIAELFAYLTTAAAAPDRH